MTTQPNIPWDPDSPAGVAAAEALTNALQTVRAMRAKRLRLETAAAAEPVQVQPSKAA